MSHQSELQARLSVAASFLPHFFLENRSFVATIRC
jgi:hypothetical protein